MNDFYISTIDENAGTLASKYGLGIEIADFCTAWNMDERLAETDAQVQKMVCGIPNGYFMGHSVNCFHVRLTLKSVL